jgi:hypothetical protein
MSGQISRQDEPQWPAIIMHHEQHELILVSSERAWLDEPQLSRFPYAVDDRLIDSRGQLFAPVYDRVSGHVEIKTLDTQIGLAEFNLLLRKHLCVQNACCISKLSLSSYQQGFDLIAANAGE